MKIKSNKSIYRTEKEKQKIIIRSSKIFGKYLTELGFDWENDVHMKDTPMRVTKAFVNDLISGCYNNPPEAIAFDNIEKYDGMVFSGNMKLQSVCCHHFLSFLGHVHVAYIPDPNGKVIGLSKLNRIVEYFSNRPQIQENLTIQIHNFIHKVCEKNNGVAVVIEAEHLCTSIRGVKHDSVMKTSKLSGAFLTEPPARKEFYTFISDLK